MGNKAFLKLGFNLEVLGKKERLGLGKVVEGLKIPGRRIYLRELPGKAEGEFLFLGETRLTLDRPLEGIWPEKRPLGGEGPKTRGNFRNLTPLGLRSQTGPL